MIQTNADTRSIFSSSLTLQLTAFVLAATCAHPKFSYAQWKEDIGFNALKQRIAEAMPDGQTIRVAQVEMSPDTSGDYLPDLTDAQLVGKNIHGLSGKSGISDHATTVGRYYFGLSSSIGPGIRLIDSFEANNWSGRGLLNINTDLPPRPETRQVQNHSWIGSFTDEALDVDTLRRVDLLVYRDGVLVVAGVRNGRGAQLPRLMSSAYNILAVGLSNGQCSTGPTRIDCGGRSKPDLVAPLSATSWATPVVASSGSLLLEVLDRQNHLAGLTGRQKRLAKPILVRALLMGGATKTEWADWRKGFATPSTDGSVPLDYRYGAGELNIDNSYRILIAGEQDADSAATVPTTGWDYARIEPRQSRRYFFEIPAAHAAPSSSILLTWNRKIEVRPGDPLEFEASLADINLALYRAEGFTPTERIDASISRVDNVEHICQKNLSAGRYMIEVTSDRAWEYALTWDVKLEKIDPSPSRLATNPPPENPVESVTPTLISINR